MRKHQARVCTCSCAGADDVLAHQDPSSWRWCTKILPVFHHVRIHFHAGHTTAAIPGNQGLPRPPARRRRLHEQGNQLLGSKQTPHQRAPCPWHRGTTSSSFRAHSPPYARALASARARSRAPDPLHRRRQCGLRGRPLRADGGGAKPVARQLTALRESGRGGARAPCS